jgi:hypothetical protein
MDWTDLTTRALIAVAYFGVPVNLWWHRRQVADPMWPPALMTAAISFLWGIWYIVLMVTGANPDFIVGFNRALHFPSAGLMHYLILFVYLRPAAVLSRRSENPEPTDVP